jgi:hypothetical protein
MIRTMNSSQILGQMRKVWKVRTTFLSDLAGRDDISLPLGLDLEHLQQLDQYDEPSILPDSILPTVEFDEDEIESVTPGLMNPPSRTSPGIDDTSFHMSAVMEISPSLSLRLDAISRTSYASLLEILRMCKTVNEIFKLPDTLSTLKRHVDHQLPFLSMRTMLEYEVIWGHIDILVVAG